MARLRFVSRLTMLIALTAALLPGTARAQDATTKDKPKAAAKAPSAIDLRPHFVEGRNSKFESWSRYNRTVTAIINGQQRGQVTTQMTITSGVSWTVDKVNEDGSAQCTMTLDWLRIESKDASKDDVVTVDSREASDNPGYAFIKNMTGTPLTCTVSSDGSVESVDGADQVAEKFEEKDKDFAPDARDWLESANDLATLPGSPAKLMLKGNWRKTLVSNHSVMSRNVGLINENINFTLRGVEQIAGIPVATVTGTATQRYEADLSKLPNGGEGLNISLTEGSTTQQVMFDLQRHEAIGRNTMQRQTTRIERATENFTIVQVIAERNQGQVLRVEETDPE